MSDDNKVLAEKVIGLIDRLERENIEMRDFLKKFIPSNDYYETNEDDEDVYVNHGGDFCYDDGSEHIGLEVVNLLNKLQSEG
ncbi:hypothetical protein VPJG_00008 [Vibrio phage jenny 12G5]|nr:hypothetical protein VPJG_00008 [Vibrio phage jenny 12G5]